MTIGGVSCTSVVVVNDSTITLATPTLGSEGFKDVVVTGPGGSGTLTNGYLALASALWLDPSDSVNGYVLTSGRVSQLNDLSGNGRHYTQGTAGNRPVISTGALNSLDAVRYTKANSEFVQLTGSPYSALTAGEGLCIVRLATGAEAAGNGLWHFGSPADSGYYPFSFNVYDSFGSDIRTNIGNPTPSLEATRGFSVISTATEWSVFIDGAQQFTTGTNTVAWATTSYLGRNNVTGLTHLDGFMGEVVVMPRELTSGERAAVKADLSRWGITFS